MPVRYRIDHGDVMVTEISGDFTADEDLAALGEIIRETKGAAFYKDRLFLIGPDTNFHNIDLAALERIKDAMEAWSKLYPGRNVRTAFVTADALQAAFVSMWQAVALANPAAVGASVRLFENEGDAVRWLKEKVAAA